jgi:hypothetical protein
MIETGVTRIGGIVQHLNGGACGRPEGKVRADAAFEDDVGSVRQAIALMQSRRGKTTHGW